MSPSPSPDGAGDPQRAENLSHDVRSGPMRGWWPMTADSPGGAGTPLFALIQRAERRGEQWGSVAESFMVLAVLIAASDLMTDRQPLHGEIGAALGIVFLSLWAIRLWCLRGNENWTKWLSYGSAGLQGLVVGWFVIQVTPNDPWIALIAFLLLLCLHSLRLDATLVASAGLLYSVELLLLGIIRVTSYAAGSGGIPVLPEYLRPGFMLLFTAFLWYAVRSARSILHFQAEVAMRREEALAEIARELEQRVQERTLELRSAVAQQAALRERERIADDLHDGLVKSVAGFSLELQVLAARSAASSELGPELRRLAQLAQGVVNEARETLSAIRAEMGSGSLEDQVLEEAHAFTARTGIPVEVQCEGTLPEPAAEMLHDLRCIASEGLENVLRHSAATRVRIAIRQASTGLELVLEDDGRGFDDGWTWRDLRQQRRFGLQGIVERAERHGGRARIAGRGLMGGCRISVHFPARGA